MKKSGTIRRARAEALAAVGVLFLAACGGGGGGSSTSQVGTPSTEPPPIAAGPNPGAGPAAAAGPTVDQTPAPTPRPTPAPTPAPTPSPAAPPMPAPPSAASSVFGSPVQNPVYTMTSRSAVDRPDDFTGPQVHVIYAVPKGGIDRQMDLTSVLPFSIGAINRWLEAQIGRKVRFDTYQGDLDIQFVQLPRTDAEYTATGLSKLYELRSDIWHFGQVPKSEQNQLVFYEGSGTADECGRSLQPKFASEMLQFSAVFLRGGLAKYPCWTETAATADAPATLADKTAMHELFHSFGASHTPVVTAPLGSEDFYKQECDLMYPFGTTECVGRIVLDPFRTFYYSPAGFVDGRANTYDSPFLTPPPSK